MAREAAWAWLETGSQRAAGAVAARGTEPIHAGAAALGLDGAFGIGRWHAPQWSGTSFAGPMESRQGLWVSWVALGWMLGAVAMLARAATTVARAERLRASTRPLENVDAGSFVQEARGRLGMTRRIRLAVTVLSVHRNSTAVMVNVDELTPVSPDRSVELQFRPGAPISGQALSPAGQPLDGVEVTLGWALASSGIGLPTLVTGEDGRSYFDDCNPRLGVYTMTVHRQGMRSAYFPVLRPMQGIGFSCRGRSNRFCLK